MPKSRQTCTRCSMHRQKCDQKEPCTRCIRHNLGASCTRKWQDGYDPRIHRMYPKSSASAASHASITPGCIINANSGSLAEQTSPSNAPHIPVMTLSSRAIVSDNIISDATQMTDPLPNPGGHEATMSFLQTLVPANRQILQLVQYHEVYLYWLHGCIHCPSFRREVDQAISCGFQVKNLNLRWCAVFFAVISSSLTCANSSFSGIWGYTPAQKVTLSRQWYKASILSLYLGEYVTKLDINSVQAIMITKLSATVLGFSTEQYVLYGAACQIAQGLGLQRLVLHPDYDHPPVVGSEILQARRDLLIKRELGRRIWSQICTQDWLSMPSSGMSLINKRHFTTVMPRRIDDESLAFADDQKPIASDFGNYLHRIASIMADFHDSFGELVDPSAQYELVLKYDATMRTMGTQILPKSIIVDVPDPSGPPWTRWARGVASILHAHKIITIHRSFLGRSFTDPRYAYTRWASVAASKTILKNFQATLSDAEMPAIWSSQSHLIGAGRTLCLDLLNRSESEPEYTEFTLLVDDVIDCLGKCGDSTLALQGIQLLSALRKEKNMESHSILRNQLQARNDSGLQIKDADQVDWPLESRQSITAMIDCTTSGQDTEASTLVNSGPLPTQRTYEPTLGLSGVAGDNGVLDVPFQQLSQFDIVNIGENLGFWADGGMALDSSWGSFSGPDSIYNGFEDTLI